MTASPYVNLIAVAEHFNVSASTIRKWVKERAIPQHAYLKIGGTFRFRIPEIEEALRPKPEVVAVEDDRREAPAPSLTALIASFTPPAPVQLELPLEAADDFKDL